MSLQTSKSKCTGESKSKRHLIVRYIPIYEFGSVYIPAALNILLLLLLSINNNNNKNNNLAHADLAKKSVQGA
jgi:hypothetical protein